MTGTVSPTATGNLVNTATVSAPLGTTDLTPGNNSATDTDTATPQADLQMTKTDGSATYTPGSGITYTIVVTNAGPSFVTGATVADTIPASITGAAWTAVFTGTGSSGNPSGSGNINQTINLAAGGTATYTVTGTVSPTATGNLVNTATVSVPLGTTDPTPGNNSATDTDTAAPQADLQITKTDGSAIYTPGLGITYSIVVTNAGPSFVTGATVADTIPADITGAAWTAVFTGAGSGGNASGSGNINETINLAAGGTATYTVTGTVSPTATGNLVNTATVGAPVGTTDPAPGNNGATDTDALAGQADLQITKTDGSATYTPGAGITYTIVVTNAGPSFAADATVADTIPAVITGATWTAVFTGTGSSGNASGSGNINQTINLAVGGTATYTVTGTVSPTATGDLVNTVTVTTPAGITDPTPGNNTATDTDTAAPQTDLQITKTDGSATYTPGLGITYTIVVTNAGPSFVTGATVADTIPAVITAAELDGRVHGDGLQRQRRRFGPHQRDDQSGGRRDGHLHGDGHGAADGHRESCEHGDGHRAGGHHRPGAGKQQRHRYGYRSAASRSADHENGRQRDVHAGLGDHVHDRGDQRRAELRDRGHGGGHDSGGHHGRGLDGRVHGHGLQRQCRAVRATLARRSTWPWAGRRPTR